MNQTPEQLARDAIDKMLTTSGWLIQSFKHKNIAAAKGIAIREYVTDTGPADYLLFVNKKPVGVIEAQTYRDELEIMFPNQSIKVILIGGRKADKINQNNNAANLVYYTYREIVANTRANYDCLINNLMHKND